MRGEPDAPACCGRPTDDFGIRAVNGGNIEKFRCTSCDAEHELFRPHAHTRPAAVVAEVATPNGTNGSGTPAGANARQNGVTPRARMKRMQFGSKAPRHQVPGLTGNRGDGG